MHDEGGVLVALLGESIKLCRIISTVPKVVDISGLRTSNGIIESLLGKVASLVWRVKDLVVEDGEVQGKAKTDWVGWSKVALGNLGGGLVSLKGLVGGLLALVANGELSEVAVVITLHLVVEDLGLSGLGGWDQVLVKDIKDVLADLGELGLDLLAVLLDQGNLAGVALGLLLLLDRGNDSPGSAAGTNNVLVSDREPLCRY